MGNEGISYLNVRLGAGGFSKRTHALNIAITVCVF